MKQLSSVFTKVIGLAFFIFLLSVNTNAQANLAVDFIKPIKTEAAAQKKPAQFSKKQKRKLRRKQFRKWRKTHRKKLGLGAGVLSMFGLLAWRRKLKKLKRKPPSGGGDDGCGKFLGLLIVMGLFSLLGRWLIKSLFGIMVGYWLGVLLGLLAGAVVIGIIWLIAKAIKK